MRHFFIDEKLPGELNELNEELQITGPEARHMAKVLRMTAGEEIILSSHGDQEKKAKAEIIKITADYITVQLKEFIEINNEPPVKVWLAQGLPKSDKMDFIVQKAVELGVYGIIPLAMENCVARYDANKAAVRRARWQKIAQEAAKQATRSRVPAVWPVTSLAELLGERKISAENTSLHIIMLYEQETSLTLKEVLTKSPAVDCYLMIIGPEGGLSSEEVKLAAEYNASLVTLGRRILRAETASLAALSIVMYARGDLGG